jgi:hypothetical protein
MHEYFYGFLKYVIIPSSMVFISLVWFSFVDFLVSFDLFATFFSFFF